VIQPIYNAENNNSLYETGLCWTVSVHALWKLEWKKKMGIKKTKKLTPECSKSCKLSGISSRGQYLAKSIFSRASSPPSSESIYLASH
jgi:hypothetical protein